MRSVHHHIEITANDPMIQKTAARSFNGLREFVQTERKRIPRNVLFEADTLECQLFVGYDPAFDGDEPPG